ncbi:MAG: AAA family ATPase, partial [Acetatifactor sp.]|nr:AAA family ATPase [Acetatifactor sp.]
VYRDIFRAIHEGKWLSIEYLNQEEKTTKYWIGIRDIDVHRRVMSVDGLHLGHYTVADLKIRIDSIQSSQVVDGSYCPVNEKLVEDIYLNPHKYKTLFDNVANLKILNYLEMCNRLDTTPYISDFELVKYLDREKLTGEFYELSEEQFQKIVKSFQYRTSQPQRQDGSLRLQQLAMNVLSIHMEKGLHVLAYRSLNLDIKRRVLRPDEEITICTEFTVDGTTQNIRRYLDAEDYELLGDFAQNQERIKDCINRHTQRRYGLVDDMPYIIGLGMDIALDLHKEYKAIMKLYQEDRVPVPIRAFFGDLLERPRARQASPITLINQRVNMDQLLAINNAMKYPVAYIQGPPGTGKTNTILNTIMTAFFNDKTVLFASNNNHPIDGVCDKLTSLQYHGKPISFPILRLGKRDLVQQAIQYIRDLYQRTQSVSVFEGTLGRNKDERKQRARKLSDLLKKYDDMLDYQERRETIERMLEYQRGHEMSAQMLPFQADLSGRQLNQIEKRLATMGEVSEEQAVALVDDDVEELKKYLYYTGASYMKRLDGREFDKLREILAEEDTEKAVDAFAKYLADKKNLQRLQKIFPIIATTCVSAHRLGEPEPMFDMVIMDEASQCNTAVSLVPIVRGNNLMLVGDPQQLSPVILLDDLVNERLKKRYCVSEEYDYRRNSIYKVYLACDAVSDEILLHNHYRCHPRIIE